MAPTLEPGTDEIFRPSVLKRVLLFLGSAAFVGAGFFILKTSHELPERLAAYSVIAFFGLCGIVAVFMSFPGSYYLRLTPEGIDQRTLYRAKLFRWSDIERFGVAEMTVPGGYGLRRRKLVGFDFVPSYPRSEWSRKLANYNRQLCGFEAALPDNYGWKHEDLAEHLNQTRERYLKQAG